MYENEPKVNPGLFELDNVVLTPHIASASEPTRQAMAMLAARNCVAALTTGEPAEPAESRGSTENLTPLYNNEPQSSRKTQRGEPQSRDTDTARFAAHRERAFGSGLLNGLAISVLRADPCG